MIDSSNKSLCESCVESIWCPTWTDVKCLALKQRIYGYKKLTECKFYKKREKDFEERVCQCESCLENDKLWNKDLEAEM